MQIKNFIQDIIQYIKNKMFSSRYVVKGKCKKCGKCCSTILLSDENGYIKTEEDFIKLQKQNRARRNFVINGIADDVEKDSPQYGALLFKCRVLRDDGKIKYFQELLPCSISSFQNCLSFYPLYQGF